MFAEVLVIAYVSYHSFAVACLTSEHKMFSILILLPEYVLVCLIYQDPNDLHSNASVPSCSLY